MKRTSSNSRNAKANDIACFVPLHNISKGQLHRPFRDNYAPKIMHNLMHIINMQGTDWRNNSKLGTKEYISPHTQTYCLCILLVTVSCVSMPRDTKLKIPAANPFTIEGIMFGKYVLFEDNYPFIFLSWYQGCYCTDSLRCQVISNINFVK